DEAEKPVYDIVSEKEYAKIVHDRMQDDWLVGDHDGREIFDDHDEDFEEDDNETVSSKPRGKSKKLPPKKSLNPDLRASSDATSRKSKSGTKDIRSMFAQSSNTSSKIKKLPDVANLDADLDGLLAEIDKSTSKTVVPSKTSSSKKVPKKVKPVMKKEMIKKSDLDLLGEESKPKQHSVNPFKAHVPQSSKERKTETVKLGKEIEVKSEPVTQKEKEEIPAEMFDDFVEDMKVEEEEKVVEEETKEAEFEFPEVESNWMGSEQEVSAEQQDMADFAPDLGTDALLFYYLDAYEDLQTHPGTIYLFGKIASKDNTGYKSACLRVTDLERRVFLLPRKGKTVKDIYSEFRELSGKMKITKFRCKPNKKMYAFEVSDVPSEAEYLEIRYRCSNPKLSQDLTGESFSHIFGTNTSFLENFLLDLRLKGPCWLHVTGASPINPQISWCAQDFDFKHGEANCQISRFDDFIKASDKPDQKLPTEPPLTLVSLDVKTVSDSKYACEIIAIGMLVDTEYRVSKITNSKLCQSHFFDSLYLYTLPCCIIHCIVCTQASAHSTASTTAAHTLHVCTQASAYCTASTCIASGSDYSFVFPVIAPPKGTAMPFDLKQRIGQWGANYALAGAKPSNEAIASGLYLEGNERALLSRFLVIMQRLDPDLVVGHDLWGHTIEWLLERINALNVPLWHRLGRLRRAAGKFHRHAAGKNWLTRHAVPGRLFCDSMLMARELVHARKYNISDLCKQVMPTPAQENGPRFVPKSIWQLMSGSLGVLNKCAMATLAADLDSRLESIDLKPLFNESQTVKDLIDFCLSDANLVLQLVYQLQVLPLAFQITSICGNILSRTLAGGRAERNEFLLLHAFSEQGYLVPDPPQLAKKHGRKMELPEEEDDPDERRAGTTGRKKPAYHGGLVLEPKKGFYDKFILLLDFNSLYPSIIQEFNICFTTVDRRLVSKLDDEEAQEYDQLIATLASLDTSANSILASTLPTNKAQGILPNELRKLVESRREVKKLIAAAGPSESLLCSYTNREPLA
ncbi:DNA polymerase alpha catalytic subunit, partial [Cichlidogyrus casuarinus]